MSTRPLFVPVAEIDRQRFLGWPDFRAEDYCHRCGSINPSWSVDSDRFNTAIGPYPTHRWNGIICVGCFVQLHEHNTGLRCTWQLTPLTPFSPIGDGG